MEIVPQYEENVVSVGLNDSMQMSFSSDAAHLFTLLSKNLYGNPRLAAVREIITNAWDSHIESGCTDKALLISYDTTSFTIRDYGTGISKDLFYSLYGVVGASTKRDDNRQTGGMGIGKMAPLACLPFFSIRSHHDGIVTTYHIEGPSEETGGIPRITEVAENPTDSTGLEVIFPTGIIHYVTEIRRVVFNGSIKAKMVNLSDNNPEPGESILDTLDDGDFVLVSPLATKYPHSSEVSLRYGNISYSFDYWQTGRSISTYAALFELLRSLNLSMVVRIDPGEATVTPNREDLVFTESLKKYLDYRFAEAYQQIIAGLRKYFICEDSGVAVTDLYRVGDHYAKIQSPLSSKNTTSTTCEDFYIKPLYIPAKNLKIPPEILQAAKTCYNRTALKKLKNIHISGVHEKKHVRFMRLLYKSGLTHKNVYTISGLYSKESVRTYAPNSTLFRVAQDKKIVIHYRANYPVAARKDDTVYIRVLLKTDVKKLTERLKNFFGVGIDITLVPAAPAEKVKREQRAKREERKYVCISEIVTESSNLLNNYPEAEYKKTVSDPLVILTQVDLEDWFTKRALVWIGVEKLKKDGVVAVTNREGSNLRRRKNPPTDIGPYIHGVVKEFSNKPSVVKYLSYNPGLPVESFADWDTKCLLEDVLGYEFDISCEDVSKLRNLTEKLGNFAWGVFPITDCEIPEIRHLWEFATEVRISKLKKYDAYDEVVKKLKEKFND